ncbi:MAG: hypothetical protein IPK13_28095 [Deltaproteobacteria bacterium]|nr:hypothetical protein [Deltaproteobacteria bacterium]
MRPGSTRYDERHRKTTLRGYVQHDDEFINTIDLAGSSDVWNDMSGTDDEALQVITLVVPERIIAFRRPRSATCEL